MTGTVRPRITSQQMNPKECETVLICMFAYDPINAWNLREFAYNSAGTWQGGTGVEVMYLAGEETYVIRYTFPTLVRA